MENATRFSQYNPIINFTFFIGAICCSMFFMHPAYLVASIFMSLAFNLSTKGLKSLKMIGFLLLVFAFVTVINPILNTAGNTVLFTYFNDRSFTLEALTYGFVFASIFVSVILWFSSYNAIMTSDKFVYIFGPVLPAISMIISMVMRFVPNYSTKAKQISTARQCIGLAGENGDKKDRLKNAESILSSLTSWAFEGGISTADSMRSRGYGTGKRTNYSIYRFDYHDLSLLITMILLLGIVAFCSISGATKVEYLPEISINWFDNIYTLVGFIAYVLFLSLPTILNIKEEITWRILRSRI